MMNNCLEILLSTPDAVAIVRGMEGNERIMGKVWFYKHQDGVLVRTEITGLPKGTKPCGSPVFGFHIHDDAGHYNPNDCPHPYHAGDLPPLFGVHGTAFEVVLTDRFTIREIIGKMVVIHGSPDDFTTQPSGNAGEKIATGVINSTKLLI